jgi:hypothetical protein
MVFRWMEASNNFSTTSFSEYYMTNNIPVKLLEKLISSLERSKYWRPFEKKTCLWCKFRYSIRFCGLILCRLADLLNDHHCCDLFQYLRYLA